MKVKFVGATKGVTGSCSLLNHEESNTKLLIDCGGYIVGNNSDWHNNQDFPFKPKELKYVLLTHAHFDHCGLIPRLYKEGFVGKVYCTRATAELARIILLDAAQHSVVFDKYDVKKIKFFYIDNNQKFEWGKPISLENDLRVSFLRSSHILGATGININWDFSSDGKGKSIFFSGDIGPNVGQNCYLPLLKETQYSFPDTNYMVVESTYGGRVRELGFKSAKERRLILKSIIEKTLFEQNGKLIIPSFSVHRAQEILVDLYIVLSEYIDKTKLETYLKTRVGYERDSLKVCLDSKMLSQANQIYAQELYSQKSNGSYKYLNDEIEISENVMQELFGKGHCRFDDFDGFISTLSYSTQSSPAKGKKKFIDYDKEREKQAQQLQNRMLSSSIIVSSSGMCDVGPITSYIRDLGGDKNNTILFTGFMSDGSEGKAILNGQRPYIKASLENMSPFYSAHADEQGLLDYIFDIGGREQTGSSNIFINHGNFECKKNFANAIEERKDNNIKGNRTINSIVSLVGDEDWFDLNLGRFEKTLSDCGVVKESEFGEIIMNLSKQIEEIKILITEKSSR